MFSFATVAAAGRWPGGRPDRRRGTVAARDQRLPRRRRDPGRCDDAAPGDTLVVKGNGSTQPQTRRVSRYPSRRECARVFIAFGAFAPHWRPSAGAPESSRATARSGVQGPWRALPWTVPTAPFDFRRTIYQQWVPLRTARSPRSSNCRRPRRSRPAPGGACTPTVPRAPTTHRRSWPSGPLQHRARPNTPKPPAHNLLWAYSPSFYRTVSRHDPGQRHRQ